MIEDNDDQFPTLSLARCHRFQIQACNHKHLQFSSVKKKLVKALGSLLE